MEIYIEVYSQQILSQIKVTLLCGKTNLTGSKLITKLLIYCYDDDIRDDRKIFLYNHTLIAIYINAMRQNVPYLVKDFLIATKDY